MLRREIAGYPDSYPDAGFESGGRDWD